MGGDRGSTIKVSAGGASTLRAAHLHTHRCRVGCGCFAGSTHFNIASTICTLLVLLCQLMFLKVALVLASGSLILI
jgi:hypothetical protein